MAIELGSKVKDTITGFVGIAVAKTQWLVGCIRVTVQPQDLDKDGKVREAYTFDEPTLVVLSTPAKTKIHAVPQTPTTPGGPRPEPMRREDVRR